MTPKIAATVEPMPGVRLELRVARDLSGADGPAVRELLGHKGQPWMAHVEDFIARGRDGAVEGLEWRIHLAERDGRPVASVCTWENAGVGLLGHVYTRPEARRQGIARALLSWTLHELRTRGAKAMALNCDADSHQASLYRAIGFEPVPGAVGAMVQRFAPPDAEATHSLRVAPFAWGDWPHLNLFMLRPDLPRVRWAAAGLEGPSSVEHALLAQVFAAAGREPARISILKTESGPVRGFACVTRARLAEGAAEENVLDFVCDVEVASFRRSLLESLGSAVDGAVWLVDAAEEASVRPSALGFEAEPGARGGGAARAWRRRVR